MIALILIASGLAYFAGAGVMHGIAKSRGWSFNDVGPNFGVVLWPLILPAVIASTMTRKMLARRAGIHINFNLETLPTAHLLKGGDE